MPGPEPATDPAILTSEVCAVYQITLEIQRLDEGPYLGTSPELPGLIVQGATPEEVIDVAPDVARDLIAVMVERRYPKGNTARHPPATRPHA